MYWTKAFYKMNEKEKDKVFEELEKKYVNLDIYKAQIPYDNNDWDF